MNVTWIRAVTFATVLLTVSNVWSRTWKDNTGEFEVEAELQGVKNGVVSLRKSDGKLINVPVKRLSTQDQAYLERQQREPPAEPPAENREPPEAQPAPIEVVGHLITNELQGGLGTTGGRISPQGRDATFVVVVIKVPRRELYPSESEYRSLVRKVAKENRKPREMMQLYHADRFTLHWDKRSKRSGNLISHWTLPEESSEKDNVTYVGFGSGFSSTREEALDPDEKETLAIAWVLPSRVARPPFRIQIDKHDPQEVPGRVIEPLPIKSSPF